MGEGSSGVRTYKKPRMAPRVEGVIRFIDITRRISRCTSGAHHELLICLTSAFVASHIQTASANKANNRPFDGSTY